MVFLKISNKQILDLMDTNKLLKLKAAKSNRDIALGLLVIHYFLCQEWYIGGITINYLKKNFEEYVHLLKPALNFMKERAKPRKFTMNFIKKHKIKFVNA